MSRFRTVYPGWYPGRTIPIHLRAAVLGRAFTSQRYFPEEVTEAVFTRTPYRERPGRDTTNTSDEIFTAGGEAAILKLEGEGDGYRAEICLILPGVDG